jgi:hypothetical protein
MYLPQIAVEISTENLQFCYPKGFLSSSSTDSKFSVVRRTFSLSFNYKCPALLEVYILSYAGFPPRISSGSSSTLYGVKGFLIPLITSVLAS